MNEQHVLYLGLEPPAPIPGKVIVHCPIIKTVPIPPENHQVAAAFSQSISCSHVIFTSKTAVELFMSYAKLFGWTNPLKGKTVIAVGQKTAAKIAAHSNETVMVAEEETAEGVVSVLEKHDLSSAFVFWPHSALSRPMISDWLKAKGIRHCACAVYNTHPIKLAPLPPLEQIDEIVFTSPSTVDAFLYNYGFLPTHIQLTCIGPVTQAHLRGHRGQA